MDDPKRIEEIARVQRDHERRIGDLESGAKRQKSEIESQVRDMIDAGARHIERVVASQAAEHAAAMATLTAKLEDVSKTADKTLGHNLVQTQTLGDVAHELELAREERIKRAAVEAHENEKKREKREEDARRLKRWVAIGAVVVPVVGLLAYLIGALVALERHEAPERYEPPEAHEK